MTDPQIDRSDAELSGWEFYNLVWDKWDPDALELVEGGRDVPVRPDDAHPDIDWDFDFNAEPLQHMGDGSEYWIADPDRPVPDDFDKIFQVGAPALALCPGLRAVPLRGSSLQRPPPGQRRGDAGAAQGDEGLGARGEPGGHRQAAPCDARLLVQRAHGAQEQRRQHRRPLRAPHAAPRAPRARHGPAQGRARAHGGAGPPLPSFPRAHLISAA